ncbi:hypothetical protein [Flavobacterium branchiicola]|uniref:Chromosome partition protein Smc n=1 Tax=Flavobacterium branchiicola TaxID=1114875 RepID=A0ABV9PFM6_9FLAO|nr:hypothetical protein [Flavobacterium branchiicola]MBS7254131.1 hypothetical protein [Flavobacterium branchiicola]
MDKTSIANDLNYLNEERVKLWGRLTQLEKEIEQKTSDFEKDAKQSSRKASEFRNKSNEAKDLAIQNAEISAEKVKEAKLCLTNIKSLETKSETSFKKIDRFTVDLDIRSKKIEDTIATLEENFENNEILVEKLETLEGHFESGEEIFGKIETLQKSIQSRKRDIDNLHRELFGYLEKETNEEGVEVETRVEGLKDQIQSTYESLEEDLSSLEKDVLNIRRETLDNYKTFIEEKEADYLEKENKWNTDYDSVLDKINKLLPNALTTGLSYAYSEKRKSEIKDSRKFAGNFKQAALGLVIVSIIPFILSVFFIFEGKTLIDVIEYSPRFVLAIIPLYIPVLWIAYSSNKKLNLSKRLIEEYTHKEVLSKTFEGLSHQINSIENEDISNDLRVKLLYNILSVSSENPGKLISDYNKSDHPLMDALEKSANLSDAVEKLEKIPGLSKIAKILDSKSKKILKEQANKIDDTLGEIVEETLE